MSHIIKIQQVPVIYLWVLKTHCGVFLKINYSHPTVIYASWDSNKRVESMSFPIKHLHCWHPCLLANDHPIFHWLCLRIAARYCRQLLISDTMWPLAQMWIVSNILSSMHAESKTKQKGGPLVKNIARTPQGAFKVHSRLLLNVHFWEVTVVWYWTHYNMKSLFTQMKRQQFVSMIKVLNVYSSCVSKADNPCSLLYVSGGNDHLCCYTQSGTPLGSLHHCWSSWVFLNLVLLPFSV